MPESANSGSFAGMTRTSHEVQPPGKPSESAGDRCGVGVEAAASQEERPGQCLESLSSRYSSLQTAQLIAVQP